MSDLLQPLVDAFGPAGGIVILIQQVAMIAIWRRHTKVMDGQIPLLGKLERSLAIITEILRNIR